MRRVSEKKEKREGEEREERVRGEEQIRLIHTQHYVLLT